MSAIGIDTFVLLFDSPDSPQQAPNRHTRLDASVGFDLFQQNNLRTLSTNTASNGDFLKGLLYVPTLPNNDPCNNRSAAYIPRNVTRLPNLPGPEFTSYIALVPWTQECISPYLAAADIDRISAFITYIPDNGTDTPPLEKSPQWSLDDGGRWKSRNKYPVYAIPGAWGFAIMQALGQYSGSREEVPYSKEIAEQYHSSDYVRLYTSIQTQAASQLPNLWAFLLIVLGIILFFMCITSFAMHLCQRKRRRDLERRIRDGEVNLEAIGVKTMAVPIEVLDNLPLTTYTPNISDGSDTMSSNVPKTISFDQPSCVICLDDFISHETMVRSLPCRHIFHPECVDQLLLQHSSLCPTCKASVLPQGYCPVKITNVMVRRERLARGFRDSDRARAQAAAEEARFAAQQNAGDGAGGRRSGRLTVGAGGRIASFHRMFTRWRNASSPSSHAPHVRSPGLEMTEQQRRRLCPQPPAPALLRSPDNNSASRISSAPAAPATSAGAAADRSERARRRISTLLGRTPTLAPTSAEVDLEQNREDLRRPKWRRAVSGVFPGFR